MLVGLLATGCSVGPEPLAPLPRAEPSSEADEEPAHVAPSTTDDRAPAAGPVAAAGTRHPGSPLGALVRQAPPGGDGPSLYRIDPAFLGDHDDPGPVIRALVWGARLLYVDAQYRLFLLGDRTPVSERVYAAPVLAPDGSTLAYVALEHGGADTRAAVHLRDDAEDRVLDRTLFNFGELRFAPDGKSLIGFGTVNGGVTGLHVIESSGKHRCLTNCDLRTGEAWGDAFVELPHSIDDVVFESGAWVTEAAGTDGDPVEQRP